MDSVAVGCRFIVDFEVYGYEEDVEEKAEEGRGIRT